MNATTKHTPGKCLLIRPGANQGIGAGSWRTAAVNTYGSVEDAECDKRDVPSLKDAVVVPVTLACAAPALLAALERATRAFAIIFDETQDPGIGAIEVEFRALCSRARGS